jgi:hypothetical protein
MKDTFLQKHATPSNRKRSNDAVKLLLTCFAAAAVVLVVYNHARFSGINSSWTASAAAMQQSGMHLQAGSPSAAAALTLSAAASDLAASLQQQATSKQQQAAPVAAAHVEGQPELWAAGPQQGAQQEQLLKLLDAETLTHLKSLCGRCLYRTLTSYVRTHDFGRLTVVLTGDIPAMWLRDSAVQMASYFPRISKRPGMRQVLEGAIRAQSYFILQVSKHKLTAVHPTQGFMDLPAAADKGGIGTTDMQAGRSLLQQASQSSAKLQSSCRHWPGC